MVFCKQTPFARAWCWSLSLHLRVLWSCLWKERLLHIPLPSIYCLLRCRDWLCWHLCPKLLAKILAKICFSNAYHHSTFVSSFQETIILWFLRVQFFKLIIVADYWGKGWSFFCSEQKDSIVYRNCFLLFLKYKTSWNSIWALAPSKWSRHL